MKRIIGYVVKVDNQYAMSPMGTHVTRRQCHALMATSRERAEIFCREIIASWSRRSHVSLHIRIVRVVERSK